MLFAKTFEDGTTSRMALYPHRERRKKLGTVRIYDGFFMDSQPVTPRKNQKWEGLFQVNIHKQKAVHKCNILVWINKHIYTKGINIYIY